MITPLQQDARRYLRRWVIIAASWAIATAVVLVWSIGDSRSPTADRASTPAAPQPVTVTAQPAAPVPTFGDPAPTRWPPAPSTAAATPIWMGITGTGLNRTLLIDQGSPKLGVPAGKACDANTVRGSTGGNVYVALIDSTAWAFCFSSADAEQIKQACSDSPNSAGGGLCALVAVGDGYYRAGTFTQDCLPATADPAAVAGRTYPQGCVQGAS
mgnify:CR=1 FL=1